MKKRTFAALTAAVLLSGCGTFVVPAYSPDYPTLDRLKGRALEPVALATVQPTDAKSAVNVITLRGAAFEPPGGSFAAYLESALRADLGELRLLNPAAPTRLSATLLKNDFDVSGFSTGTGTLVVRIAIARAGQPVLDKTYSATTAFPSHFAANVAVPRAQAEYPSLVRRLLQTVYADPAFLAALKK